VRTISICSPATYTSVVPLHLAFPGEVADTCTNIQQVAEEEEEEEEEEEDTLHVDTCAMRGCGFTSLVVCIDDKFLDTRERM
jgi:hypothetical protein